MGFHNVGEFAKRRDQAKVLAIMDAAESRYFPGVPTVEKAIGVKLSNSSSRGLAAPTGTPKEIVWYLSYAMEQAMKDAEFMKKMDDQGLELRYMNPDQFDKYWREFEQQVKVLMPLALESQK